MARPIDAATLAALNGSRTGDQITVWAWYDGKLAHPEPLNVSAWAMDWDDSRGYQSLTLTVQDPTGDLAPWLLEDPLGAGGARLQVTYTVGSAGTVNLGWYRITDPDPSESWVAYTIAEAGTTTPGAPVVQGAFLRLAPMGATIGLAASDLARVVANDRFVAPESPQGTAPTVLGEIRRLLLDRVPVVVDAGVTDTAVNRTLVYEQQGDRWAAVQDLAKRLGAAVRMNGDGQAEVYPLATADPVATLYGGPEGLLVRVSRGQSYDGLYNYFVADGTATTPDGQSVPIRGSARIETGPLRYGGPHGRYPKFYSSTMLTTQAQCDAYAKTMRDTQVAGLTIDLAVEALPLPHLQLGDWVTVANPVTDGGAVPLNGRVVKMGMRGSGNAVDRMSLTVRCSYADVAAALGAGSGQHTIAGPIVRNQPGIPSANTGPNLYPSDYLYPRNGLYPSGSGKGSGGPVYPGNGLYPSDYLYPGG